jgi:16S rRNA (cytosine967-C5)-methyltransferase
LFDAVLLDAPCSATGIFRRHPDVLHRAQARVIATLAAQQHALLARAAGHVAPGGTLVYAVCSLEPAEGEAIADAFAADRRFARAPVRAEELPDGFVSGGAGRVRVLPGMFAEAGGVDGFFVARFTRID